MQPRCRAQQGSQPHGAKRIVGGAGLVSGILCWVRLWKVSEVCVGEELYGLQHG